jgi:hypothetical protein
VPYPVAGLPSAGEAPTVDAVRLSPDAETKELIDLRQQLSAHEAEIARLTKAEQLHTGDDPIVDACTGVISALEEIIEELGPPRDSDVSDALELAQGALEEMRVIDAWAVAKAGEAQGASAIPTDSDAETKELIDLRQQLSAHEAEIAQWRGMTKRSIEEGAKWMSRAEAAEQQVSALRQELTELRERDRVLSRHLEQRATGRDPLAQSLMAAESAALEQVKALTQQVEQLKGVALAALEAKAAFIRRLADGFTHDSEKTE